MSSYKPDEYAGIISKFDMSLITNLDPKDYVDFGVMDSKKYAAKLFKLMEDERLTKDQKTMVIVLATAVKSRTRILNSMKKFKGKPWYNPVFKFFKESCVQYTTEEDDDNFSVVHIPSSVPFLTARVWLQMTPDPTVDLFLQNLWAAQINIDDNLLNTQRIWEEDFWNVTVVQKNKNKDKSTFNRDFWDTKAADQYLLLDKDGNLFGSEDEIALKVKYSRKSIEAWIKTRVNHDNTDIVEQEPQQGASGQQGNVEQPQEGAAGQRETAEQPDNSDLEGNQTFLDRDLGRWDDGQDHEDRQHQD